MGLLNKGGNKLSSTNIAAILEAQIEAIKKVNDVIVQGKVDEAMLKNVQNIVKPISETIKALGDASKIMGTLKLPPLIGNIGFKMGIKGLVANIKVISEELGNIEFDKKVADNVKLVCDSITKISSITGDLLKIGMASILLVVMKPLIIKTIKLITEIGKELSVMDGGEGIKTATAMGDMLSSLGKGLLIFVLTTMGGLVPLVAMVSLLAVKAFVWLFLKLFSTRTEIQIMKANITLKSLAATLLLLSMTVLLWALMGVLIMEAWKEIGVTILFIFFAILVFTFLGEMIAVIKVGQASIKQISMTLLILSLTVLLWALMGDLIMEEWKSIAVTIIFVISAIAMFTFLGWAMKFIQSGEKSLLKIALTLIVLSLTVLLWALMGDLIIEEWWQILLVGVFVGVVIGVMWLLSKASKSIDGGAKQILIMAVAIAVLSLDIFLMAAAGKTLIDNWLPILAVMGFVVLIIAICALLTWGAAFIEPGVIILKGIAIALVLIAASFLVFAIAVRMYNKETCENMRNMFEALVDSMVYAGLRIPFLILGSVGIAIMSAAMLILAPTVLILALALKVIKDNNIKAEDAARPIDMILSVVNAVNSRIGWRMMWRIAKATFKIFLLIPLAIALGIITKVVADIAALKVPTKFDKDGNATEYQKMTTEDFVMAAANAAAIASILANLFGEEDMEIAVGGSSFILKPIKQAALENITVQTMIKMILLMIIVKAIGNMAGTLSRIASLIVPDETKGFDKDGNPLGWRKMTTKDFVEASENVAIIAMTLVFGLTQYKAKFLGGKTVSEAIEDLSWKAIVKMAVLFDVFGRLQNLVEVVQMMAQMAVPTKWDKEGKPIAFRILTPEERQKAIENTVILMTEFLSAIADPALSDALAEMDSDATENFATIMNATAGVKDLIEAIEKSTELDEEKIGMGISNMKTAIERYVGMLYELFVETWEFQYTPKHFWGLTIPWWSWVKVKDAIINVNQMEQAVEKMKLLTDTMSPLKSLMDGIKDLSEQDNIKSTQKGINSLKDVVKAYTEIFTGNEKGQGGVNITPTGEKKFQRFKEILEYQDKFAKINSQDLTANTDNFVRFIDKANSIDSDKIKSIRDMFEQMAEFSKSVKGDFDKLADVLSEKLVVILEKLHGTLEGMNTEGVESATAESTPTEKAAPKTPEEKAKEEKQKQQEKNLKDIKNALEEITSALRDIKDNTENFSRY